MELKKNFSKRVKDAANKFCPGSLVPVEDCSLYVVQTYNLIFHTTRSCLKGRLSAVCSHLRLRFL